MRDTMQQQNKDFYRVQKGFLDLMSTYARRSKHESMYEITRQLGVCTLGSRSKITLNIKCIVWNLHLVKLLCVC